MLPSIFGENLFDDSLSDFFDFGRMMPQVSSELYGKHARNLMKTDVRELDGSYELDVDLPGFKKDEVTVDLQDGYLTISAAKGLDKDESDKKGKFLRQERYAGSMSRSFYVGDDVESVAREVEEEYNVPILTVECCGFLGAEYYDGYFEITQKLLERFVKPCAKQKDSVLLLGDNGGPWGHYAKEVTRILQEFGVEVIGQFPGYMAMDELERWRLPNMRLCLAAAGRRISACVRLQSSCRKNTAHIIWLIFILSAGRKRRTGLSASAVCWGVSSWHSRC